MNPNEVEYERRPLEGQIDVTMKTFMDIMDIVAIEQRSQWSFVGGLPRDLYKGFPFDDYDVCIQDVGHAKRVLEEMGLLVISPPQDGEIPHDMYHDPYSFDKTGIPIHWIQADDERAFAPVRFDFSINQICLKSDGYFYAPKYAWRDLDKGIVRKTGPNMTTSLAARAIRFACKYDMWIESDLNKEIMEFVKRPMGTDYLLRTCQKMIEDGNGERCFMMMGKRGFPHMEDCPTIEDYVQNLSNIIVTGRGHRERITGGHDY